jgi:hypothetical protein
MKFKRTALYVAVTAAIATLSACGGGGGGGGSSATLAPFVRTEVPYATPVRVGTVDPLVNNQSTAWVGDTYVANISGAGEDVIIAGAATAQTSSSDWSNTRLSIFSWQNGTLVDKTSQWFTNDSNIIVGTNTVKFADFFNTGRTGMVTAPYSDWSLVNNGPAYVWTNNGTSFTRQTIAVNVSAHDFEVADINNDGYKDIVILDANAQNSTLAINDRVSSFQTYRATSGPQLTGSGIAIADFLNNGTSTFITADNWSANGNVQKLWGWNIDSNNQLTFNEIATLPTSRFNLQKWRDIGILDSHNIRVAAHDFNNDNKTDAIVFSQPGVVMPGTSTNYSEIQFLKNNGGGSFTDVTDTTLVGYNTNTRTTYQPKFLDLNGDGLTDILVSGGDNTGASSQFLLKSSDGKYVATYANVLSDYLRQVKNLANADGNDHTVNVVRAPDGKLYLVSAVSFMNGTDRQLAVYISALGSQSVTTAQTAINLMLQRWPYMTAAQANAALARTTSTYLNGVAVIDENAILNPIGDLSLPTMGGFRAINGFIAGINLNNGSVVAMDQAGRSYNMNLASMSVSRLNAFGFNTQHNDQYELTSHAEYLVNGNVTTVNGLRLGSDFAGRDANNMTALNKPTQYTLGVPRWYQTGNWSLGTQYTYLNSNPWIAFDGAWGSVNSSGVMDNVVTYRKNGFSAQASLMHVSTNINPGLITRVSDMWGAWAETGYRFGSARENGNMGIYAGIKPVVLSGSVDAQLPTAVDNRGNIVYSSKKLTVQNQTAGYLRALYTNQLDRRTQLRLSAIGTTDGQYRAMTEIKFWID